MLRLLVLPFLAWLLFGGSLAPEAAAQEPTWAAPQVAGPASIPDPLGIHLAWRPPDTLQVTQAFEMLEEGLSLWDDGHHREGAELADDALALLPTMADWRPLLRAELLAAAGDTAGVRRALDELDPDSEFRRRWGWKLLVDAFEEADDPTGGRGVALRFARSATIAEEAGAGWLRASRLALADGDSVEARELLGRVLATDAGDGSVRSAARLLDDLAEPGGKDLDLLLGRALLAGASWQRAHHRLKPHLEAEGVDFLESVDLRVELGRALVELNRPREAAELLEPLTGEGTPEETAARALYWSGRAALSRNRQDEAREAFLELARRSPDSPLAEEGLVLLLDHLSSDGRGPEASDLLGSLFAVGVGSPSGELAAMRVATGRYLVGDFQGAASTFEEYLEAGRRGTTRQQAAYWAALAREREGDPGRARELFRIAFQADPFTFYGSFAADRLDEPLLPTDLPVGPTPTPGIAREVQNALIRLRVHQRVPLAGSFAWELERLERHFLRRGDGAYDFAEALLEGGFPIQGVVLGRQIRRQEGEWNLRLLRIVYPFPFREAIAREAGARGLDPFFVAGLIRQESLFHPTIRSSAGAVGLMQLLPSTAGEVARAEGLRFSPGSLADPEMNVRLGTAFLASLVRRFDGRAEDALSAYNAGPTRIRRWRQRPEYRDPDVFVERIPFRETRHYVKTVQQNTRIYTALYGCGDFQPCLGLSYRAAVERSPLAGGAPTSALAR